MRCPLSAIAVVCLLSTGAAFAKKAQAANEDVPLGPVVSPPHTTKPASGPQSPAPAPNKDKGKSPSAPSSGVSGSSNGGAGKPTHGK